MSLIMVASSQTEPFIKLFRSPRQYYLYSVNKNSIIEIPEPVFFFLDGKNECRTNYFIEEYLFKLQGEGFLSSSHISEIHHPDLDIMEYALENRLEHLVLQVTQSCNLVCSYCPYANKTDGVLQRNHSNRSMSFETAKKAIDFFLLHSGERKKNVISFYGGEPLVSFELIKQIVEYIKETFVGKDVHFNMTTNATLFTDEIISFLVENNFDIVFSIDGPAEIHDINRKHRDGSGSFNVAFSNLKKIIQAYGENYRQHISLNMVIDPNNDVDKILELFNDPIFCNEINVMADVADDIHLNKTINENDEYLQKMNYQYFLGYLDFLQIIDGLSIPPFIKTSFAGVEKEYATLKKGASGLPEKGAPGGPCIPGQRSLFVNVDGIFFPCEKVSELSKAMQIGSIDSGFDFDHARAILDIANLTPEKCKDCWALLHCRLCARFADYEGQLSKEMKNNYCYKTLNYATHLIREYILIQECNTIYTR